jgi:hypothetical protein
MQYAFINSESIVVQLIVGQLNAAMQATFLGEYSKTFGAVAILEVPADTAVYIGGSYTDGEFLPPPAPEPEPVLEPLPEPLPEPELEPEI